MRLVASYIVSYGHSIQQTADGEYKVMYLVALLAKADAEGKLRGPPRGKERRYRLGLASLKSFPQNLVTFLKKVSLENFIEYRAHVRFCIL